MHDAYLQLKLAWELFQTAPGELDDAQMNRVSEVLSRQYGIEQRILESDEAAQVVVPSATLAARLGEIRQRYTDPDAMAQDLARSGLDEAGLEEAVSRDLRIEAVLERIAAAVPAVTAVDAEIYYRMHPEAFDRPEARRLRHILITFDSRKDKADATARLETLRHTVKDADAFGKVALRHSQCPTAMEGGKLGTVKRGQLFPELEPAAFALETGEISAVLESPIGLHILLCEEILPHGIPPFDEVRDRIIERLADKRRQTAQRDWIKRLGAPR